LLHQPPHIRPGGANLLRDLGAAHHHGRVVGQEPDNAAQASVRLLV